MQFERNYMTKMLRDMLETKGYGIVISVHSENTEEVRSVSR